MLRAALLAAAVAVAVATEVRIHDCGSAEGVISSIDVTPCVGAPDTCKFLPGSSPQIKLTFTPSEAVTAVTGSVHATVHGVTVPFPLPNPDGCSKSGLACPLVKGSKVTYTANINIPRLIPKTLVSVKWELKDQNGDDLVCFIMRGPTY